MEWLFVYGTLREPDVQRRIIGRVVNGARDRLAGFRVDAITLDGVTYPIIVAEPGHMVDGMILELTPDELERADEYEGSEYRRFRVTLESGAEAWVYGE